jgi:hypothetical protein
VIRGIPDFTEWDEFLKNRVRIEATTSQVIQKPKIMV